MMQVKTFLDKSSIEGAGIGLFAGEFIPKDTIVWAIDSMDNIYTHEEVQAMNPLYKEFIDIYSFMFNGKYILCVDNARFFNHSDSPNCYSADFNEFTLGCTRAKRDIEIGEELTDNYSLFGFTDEDKQYNQFK